MTVVFSQRAGRLAVDSAKDEEEAGKSPGQKGQDLCSATCTFPARRPGYREREKQMVQPVRTDALTFLTFILPCLGLVTTLLLRIGACT